MHVHDKILFFIKANGPITPTKVAKNIKESTLIAAAHLSDLTSQRKVRISKLKIGGSPLYYLPGQEAQLFKFAAGNMNPKDLVVLEKLRDEKVLREDNVSLLAKVALRSLKDFAIPLQVTTKDRTELFWKWHLLSQEDANSRITALLGGKKEEPVQEKVEVVDDDPTEKLDEGVPEKEVEPVAEDEAAQQSEIRQADDVMEEVMKEDAEPTELGPLDPLEDETPDEETESAELAEKEEDAKEIVGLREEPFVEEKQVQEANVVKEPVEKIVKKEEIVEPVIEETTKKEETVEKPVLPPKDEAKDEQQTLEEKKVPLLEKLRQKIASRKKVSTPDTFLPIVEKFFSDFNIDIRESETVRKNTEHNLMVHVPSVIGKTIYFCKAKKKSRPDEKDLSAAYIRAQMKKMPLLFLHTGTLTTRAEELLASGELQNVIVKRVE